MDVFSESFSMKINGEETALGTMFGTLCTLILLLITAAFAAQKFKVLKYRSDVDILEANKDLYFTDDDVFSYADGLNIAVAFTSYSKQVTYELPRQYGELFINSYSWGFDETTREPFTNRVRLDQHRCTNDELALGTDDSGARFYPIHASSKETIRLYRQKFICTDPKEMEVYGDFNSAKAR